MATSEEIVTAARRYMCVQYKHQGRNRLGLDCLGLVLIVGRDLGIELQDLQGYARMPDGSTLLAEASSQLVRVDQMRPGCIILMRFKREPQHLAIVTDHPNGLGMIHSYSGAGRVVEHRIDDQWAARIVGVFSYPEVTE